MVNFEELQAIADKAGRKDLTGTALERIRQINERTKTGVFVTGGMNCGKTTVLNGITGTVLREPGLLSEKEKPLRVVFEKAEEENGFENRTVANREWNNEDAVLYEMKLDDILEEDGKPKHILDLADVVFYVISAVAPFTAADMEAVRALSFLKVQVVLNKMDLLDVDSSDQVEDYAEKMCAGLGVPAPLVLKDVRWDQAAKTFRRALPSWKERELLRREHMEAVRREAAGELETAIREQIRGAAVKSRQDMEEHARKTLETQEQQALWRRLRAQMLERCDELLTKVRENTERAQAAVIEELYASAREAQFDEDWIRKQIPRLMEEKIQSLAESQKEQIETRMREDCRDMMKRAVNLGLTTGFDLTDADFVLMTSVTKPGYRLQIEKAKYSGDSRILLGTGIAAGLFLLLPIPTTLGVAGTVAAAGIGGSAYLKDKKEKSEKLWEQQIREYSRMNLRNLGDALSASVRDYYGKLADTIRKRAEALQPPQTDESAAQRRTEELNSLLARCRELLDDTKYE